MGIVVKDINQPIGDAVRRPAPVRRHRPGRLLRRPGADPRRADRRARRQAVRRGAEVHRRRPATPASAWSSSPTTRTTPTWSATTSSSSSSGRRVLDKKRAEVTLDELTAEMAGGARARRALRTSSAEPAAVGRGRHFATPDAPPRSGVRNRHRDGPQRRRSTPRVGVIGTGMIGQTTSAACPAGSPARGDGGVSTSTPHGPQEVAGGRSGAACTRRGPDLVDDRGRRRRRGRLAGPAHEEYVLACIAAGKPVFCEKPLATTARPA